MAEEQIMSQASQSLVLQTERERFLSKLQNLKSNNLTAKQQNDSSSYLGQFADYFVLLIYKYIGLSRAQLKGFNASELKILDELISHKAWPRAIYQILFTFGVPVLGWLIGPCCWHDKTFLSWRYIYYRQRLRKIHGKKFFPFEILKQELQSKSL